jgi:hypothetical protein
MRERRAVKQSQLLIAQTMLTDGESVEKVLKYTKLTPEEILHLRN